jgi:hypothetical protein
MIIFLLKASDLAKYINIFREEKLLSNVLNYVILSETTELYYNSLYTLSFLCYLYNCIFYKICYNSYTKPLSNNALLYIYIHSI